MFLEHQYGIHHLHALLDTAAAVVLADVCVGKGIAADSPVGAIRYSALGIVHGAPVSVGAVDVGGDEFESSLGTEYFLLAGDIFLRSLYDNNNNKRVRIMIEILVI